MDRNGAVACSLHPDGRVPGGCGAMNTYTPPGAVRLVLHAKGLGIDFEVSGKLLAELARNHRDSAATRKCWWQLSVFHVCPRSVDNAVEFIPLVVNKDKHLVGLKWKVRFDIIKSISMVVVCNIAMFVHRLNVPFVEDHVASGSTRLIAHDTHMIAIAFSQLSRCGIIKAVSSGLTALRAAMSVGVDTERQAMLGGTHA